MYPRALIPDLKLRWRETFELTAALRPEIWTVHWTQDSTCVSESCFLKSFHCFQGGGAWKKTKQHDEIIFFVRNHTIITNNAEWSINLVTYSWRYGLDFLEAGRFLQLTFETTKILRESSYLSDRRIVGPSSSNNVRRDV